MKDREWHFIDDKLSWGEGPWITEPDKAQWIDEATGLPCLLVRSIGSGALCGYVGVDETHPWYQKDYQDIPSLDAVHGSLTYAALCAPEGGEQHAICHVADPREPEPLWWFGFDCSHLGDLTPASDARDRARGWASIPPPYDGSYKDVAYVKEQCAELAQQLSEAQ